MDGPQNAQSQSEGPQMESKGFQAHGSQVDMQGINAFNNGSQPHTIGGPREITVPCIRVHRRSWDFMVSY